METVLWLADEEMRGLNDWVDQMDRGGPFAPLEEIKEKLDAAPSFVKGTPHWQYLLGVYYGRLVHEGPLEDLQKIPPMMEGVVYGSSLDEMRAVLDAAGEAERMCADYALLQGYYEGRLIHEQLGGIREGE